MARRALETVSTLTRAHRNYGRIPRSTYRGHRRVPLRRYPARIVQRVRVGSCAGAGRRRAFTAIMAAAAAADLTGSK